MRKLALKKLKLSDLSFFQSHFSKNDSSKQKGFNLDASVLDGQFYPGLKEVLSPRPKKSTHVDLTLFGPGVAPAYTLARKIKIDAKNLRLNGELIHDPEDQLGRFKNLDEGDFVLLEFGGAQLPETVRAVLISSNEQQDAALHAGCMKRLPKKSDSMCSITEEDLQSIIKAASPVVFHPVMDWLEPELVEGVAAGDLRAIEEVNRRRAGRGMSSADLKNAKASAERTGEIGEELLDSFFSAGRESQVDSHIWTSQENAISLFDFLVNRKDGQVRHADAKSTSGKFEAQLYLSIGEIRHALTSDVPYDIYRLYGVSEAGAELRIARDIKKSLEPLKEFLAGAPEWVRVDSLAFDPRFFDFQTKVWRIDSGL